jgi:hypothetical protein
VYSSPFDIMSSKCVLCGKTVFQMEMLRDGTRVFHERCYKCFHCKARLQAGKYSEIEGRYYCVLHSPSSQAPPVRQEPAQKPIQLNIKTTPFVEPILPSPEPILPSPEPLTAIVPLKRLPPLPPAKYPDLKFPFGMLDSFHNGIF